MKVQCFKTLHLKRWYLKKDPTDIRNAKNKIYTCGHNIINKNTLIMLFKNQKISLYIYFLFVKGTMKKINKTLDWPVK